MCSWVTLIHSVTATSLPIHSLSRSMPGITILAIAAGILSRQPVTSISRLFLATGGAAALLAVALGAFGAHALRNGLSAERLAVWHTGIEYHVFHALGLLAMGAV